MAINRMFIIFPPKKKKKHKKIKEGNLREIRVLRRKKKLKKILKDAYVWIQDVVKKELEILKKNVKF